MIPASFPLILVAVVCLAIGLVRGSSSLLIASIVASLLAAVALVIGARRNAAAHRPESPDDDFPPPPAPRRTTGAPSDAHDSAPAGDAFAADSRYAEPPTFASAPPTAPEPPAGGQVYEQRAAADHGEPVDLPPATDDAGAAGTHLPDETVVTPVPAADYQAASSTIGAARGGHDDDQSWRRPMATDAGLDDGFGEPDADDPDDEPLPQAVRPADAVQVARFDTEVLVVDGRPRYHMADCPHLVGRLTEPLPAAEAVELGFSPCGLCRPVDRLLGANARR
ncbi:hypothetical protein ACWT_1647 [Actinoplanes sp. SE50]|uniref:hypothetical protein n=1 Tax=unclassified Actinoplanes TaxID=2626549 RepID=UPI00023ECC51|nr:MULTISPECIES: hypothetical protein [unclassified Actinoplanes]AEV82666.1 hypothetical protein ACPL_1769 [Actinoplanes sp. SE50/110]ATO81062.1 hypothetical protein ACWT_1647 [Actinoplanes sp. SE50]SLL98469.1 uncharacterized protein ACSP50_1695 [Actinoplanes sp. SE50/110]